MKAKRSTFKVLFYLKKKAERADGKVPVMIRITVDGEIAQLSAKLFVTPGLWDTAAGKVSGKSAEAVQTNPLLEQIKARIVQHYNRIMQEEDFATAEKVKNAFLGIGVMNRTLMKDYAEFNASFKIMVESGTRESSTLAKYQAVYKHLSNFLSIQKNRKDIAYKELTEQFIIDFDSYLRDIIGLSHNTVWLYTMPVLHFVREAWFNGIIKTNPFRKYEETSTSKETDRTFLTEEELTKVATVELRLAQTRLVRDMYIFCCWTGLSHTDLRSLTYAEIQKSDYDGRYWIITRRNKSEVSSNIPLLDIPLQLIEKYRGLAKGNKVFPVPSDSSCNTQLRKIALQCGIQKEFTFHSSRHTFATTVILSNGGTIESLSKMMGHKNITTTQIYAKITNEKISRDVEHIIGNLDNLQNKLSAGA